MDAALYEKLLEDLRSDLAQTAPKLQELQSVESFLQRRLETAGDKSSYQTVLDDIRTDISSQNQTVAELQRIEGYVSRQLGKPRFELELPAAVPVATPVSSPSEAKPVVAAKVPPVKKPEPLPAAIDDDTKDESPSLEKRLAGMSSASSGMTIEFGPDGFPIHNAGPGKGKSDKKAILENAGMDGATINFGPDGFPLDMPKAAPKKK